ncbi:helix-turn-helix domain-containing protein [Massiliimalia massiliensis]|uniref:helix-turn-helix domain-containing protein n=1 Tax=Massiliimalia massiliensis TaxID=1852384 RepID=UPI000986C847|nr:helix-turn-helix transcriptional regulator [Massiliimalia massiliensis]
MNSDFPRILTLLRKERGISQKQAAAELNISQALLSHYEKGIRECGLDFVVRTADFYGVSCDYLLGRSPERTGATLSVDDLPDPDAVPDNKLAKGSIMPVLNKKLIVNSLAITFDLLQQFDHNDLTTEVSNYLMLSVYHMFRMLYSINPKNESNLFTVPQNISSQMITSNLIKCEANLRWIMENGDNKKEKKLDRETLSISSQTLQKNYPQLNSSLLNLIKNSENIIKK